MTYPTYLKNKHFTESSIKSNQRAAHRFKQWLKNQKLTISHTTYNDITTYINHLKHKGNVQRTIQLEIGMLKHYFTYQKQIGNLRQVPIQHIKIQGIKRQKLYTILKLEELDYIYHNYPVAFYKKASSGRPASEAIQHRNKIILSLLIYQGLTTTDLQNLKLEHISLNQGSIYIPETKQSNSRTLKLEAHQVITLQNYIQTVREELLTMNDIETDQLIFSNGKSQSLHNALNRLMTQIKKELKEVETVHQIRTSVITHWLKQYNLRETQYRAGHKYVSSTEAYRINDIESLQNDIIQYSPSIIDTN